MNPHLFNSANKEAEAQAQTESARALPAQDDSEIPPGAPPSNTAPDNCKGGDSSVLRAGVDSLYLSFSGDLRESFDKRLDELKALAQSEDEEPRSKAALKLLDSEFQVLPAGTRNYPFILKDGMFHIQLSRSTSNRLPLAYVQIASRALTEAGMSSAFEYLDSIVRQLGIVSGTKVSRVDICCDFITDVLMGALSEESWVSRSRKTTRRSENGRFTGYVFGEGAPISARLYDKTLQILKSRQDYVRDLWWIEGWDGEATVWRLEFQVRREVLVEFGIDSFEDLKARLQALWRYATANWLRLAVPGQDKTRSRWPNHPLWDVLAAAEFGDDDGSLVKRRLSQCAPDDRYLFTNGLAPLTSYMAKNGILSFQDAWPRYIKDAEEFHAFRSFSTGDDIESYCRKKAALKGRKYSKSLIPLDDEAE